MPLDSKQHLYLILSVCAGLVIITLVVYWPVHNHEFIDFDDDAYVTENTAVQSGLSRQNLQWAFTTNKATNWHPLTWLSLMLDVSVFGVKPGPMHLVNVAFHIANTLLLFIVFNLMTKRVWPSAFIAALFALHPLHVESVAWIAERKDVLSTLFWLLTMLAYVLYVKRGTGFKPVQARPCWPFYIAALIFFALGIMSKPMLVTLPFVLIILDYWPLNRFLNSKLVRRSDSESGFSILNSILEKIPFLILTVISSIITYIVQQKGGAVAVMPFKLRFFNAVCSYFEYIIKLFVPTHLTVLYPYPAGNIPLAKVIIFMLILILLSVFLLYYGRHYKYLAFGWLWYLGTLVPVIGIVQVGSQAMADRYTYVPFIGLFVIIAFGAADLALVISHKRLRSWVLGLAFCVLCLACIITTSIQLKYWQNSVSLFEHTLSITKNNFNILNNYGTALIGLNRPQEAIQYLTKAIELHPEASDFHNNLGVAFKNTGRFREAVEQYQIALKLDPNYASARQNLAIALALKGDYDGAIEQYKIYIGPHADVAKLHQDLASMLVEEGRTDDATGQLQKALVANPDSVEILAGLGYTLAQSGKSAQAIEYYYKALQLDPNNIIVHGRLALALAAISKIDEAIEHCRIVLAADPNDVEMHNNVGILLQTRGRLNEAAQSFKKALQIDPDFQPARENLNALVQK